MKRPGPSGRGAQTQMWSTFLRNHAREVLACDFFVTMTAGFRLVYVFVVLDISTRRLVHWNVTEHSTSEWTGQQFRASVTGDHPYRFVIHDHDAIYSGAVDGALKSMHLRVLTTPVRAPKANAHCERLIGTMRRECVDFMIPRNEQHLRRILAEWAPHYNGVDHTRVSAREFPTGHRVSRHRQPVIGFRTGIGSTPRRFSAASITNIVLSPPQRDFLRSTALRHRSQRPIANVVTLEEVVTTSVASRRFALLLFGGFSALALLLALGGIHGVFSYSVTRQLPEIGVRLALGATPGDLH
jgi:Integrase core domain